jgi:hypothetical protein
MSIISNLKNPLVIGAGIGAITGLGLSASNIKNPQDEPLGIQGNAANTLALTGIMAGLGLGAAAFRKPLTSMFKGGIAASGGYKALATSRLGKGMMLAAGGAAIGAALDSNNRGQGAMIGAGLGLAGGAALRARSVWKAASSTRKRLYKAGMFGTAIAIGAGVLAYKQSKDYESTTYGSPDGYGGSTYSDRLQSLNATGDVTLGSHRGRH